MSYYQIRKFTPIANPKSIGFYTDIYLQPLHSKSIIIKFIEPEQKPYGWKIQKVYIKILTNSQADGKLQKWVQHVVPCKFKLNIRKKKYYKIVKKVWKAYKRVAKSLRESKEVNGYKEVDAFCMFVNDLKKQMNQYIAQSAGQVQRQSSESDSQPDQVKQQKKQKQQKSSIIKPSSSSISSSSSSIINFSSMLSNFSILKPFANSETNQVDLKQFVIPLDIFIIKRTKSLIKGEDDQNIAISSVIYQKNMQKLGKNLMFNTVCFYDENWQNLQQKIVQMKGINTNYPKFLNNMLTQAIQYQIDNKKLSIKLEKVQQ